jgi:hypothetical protein
MSVVGRNPWLAAALLTAFGIGAAILPSTSLRCGLATLLGLAGVALLRGSRWRTGALVVSALALGLSLVAAMDRWLSPKAQWQGVVYVPEFASWAPLEPVLGFRLRPGNTVHATATLGEKTVYSATYTVGSDGWRMTPDAPRGAATYIFMGDSCVFGQGLDDDQTLAAQFARANDFKVRTVNMAVPGYGPTHLVRAFEAGLLDGYAGTPVKAVVTWIKPSDLSRSTGDEPWLKTSPRYALEHGTLRFTGSFGEHRWADPVDGLAFLARQEFPFLEPLGRHGRQVRQGEMLLALIGRLQALARERLGAPLILVLQWPDEALPPEQSSWGYPQPLLKEIFGRLRGMGMPMVSVAALMEGIEVSRQIIEHDGHPSALTNRLIALELKRRLTNP